MAEGNLKYVITIDDEQFRAKLRENANLIRSFNNQVVSGTKEMGGAFDKLGNKIAAAFSIAALIGFGKKVFETRAYFQDIESSMKVFLGSAEKAATFTKQLKDYAYYNMFEFKDLAKASQSLIAYGNNVNDIAGKGGILDKLSNIATGTKSSLQDMVDMYNKAKNLGSIGSVYLQQWASRGLVVTDVLKEMGEEVDGTKVSFEQLNMAIDKVTGEGGMFHGLMEEMMPNLSSSWGQLQDNLANMLDELGRGMQESMRKGIDAASWAVDHYKEIGKVLIELIATYGAYKAAIIAVNAVQKAGIAIKAFKENIRLVIMFRKELGLLKASQQAFNATALANPYALVAAAIMAVVAALALWGDKNDELAEATVTINNNLDDETGKLDDLKDKINDTTSSQKERLSAIRQFNNDYGNYLSNLLSEKSTVEEVAQAYREAKQAIVEKILAEGKSTYISSGLEDYTKKQSKFFSSLKSLADDMGMSQEELGKVEGQIRKLLKQGQDTGTYMGLEIGQLLKDKGFYSSKSWQLRRQAKENDLHSNFVDLIDSDGVLYKNIQDYEEWSKGIKSQFEDVGTSTSGGSKSPNFQNYIKAKQKEFNDAKKEYERLKQDANATKDEIDSAKEAMDEAAKALKDYGYNESGKKMTKAEKELYRQERYSDAVREELKERARRQQEDIEAEKLAAMDEGHQKERESLNRSKELELYELGQWQKKMLDAELENQKTAYKERTGKNAPYNMALESTETVLDIIDSYWEQRESIDQKYLLKEGALEKKQAEQASADRIDYLIQYGNYQEQKLAITEKYAKLISEADNEWQKKNLEKQKEKELYELEKQNNSDLMFALGDPSGKTMDYLQNQLKAVNNLISDYTKNWGKGAKGADKNIDAVKDLRDQITAILDEMEKANEADWNDSFEGILRSVATIKNNLNRIAWLKAESARLSKSENEEDQKAAKAYNQQATELENTTNKMRKNLVTQGISFAVNNIANGLAKAAEYAQQIADITGDTKLADWADQAGALAQNFQAAGQGLASGGWIGAIAGGASDILSQTQQAIFEHKLWIKQFEQSIKNFRSAIELAEIVFDADKFEDMFGTRSLESAVEAYNKSNELLAKYNATVNEAFELGDRTKMRKSLGNTIFQGDNALTTLTGFSTKGFDFGLGAFKSWFGLQKKTTQKWYSELDAYQRGLNKLQAIQVQVKKATGWAKLWGHQSKYKSLFDVAPEIWGNDINGEFDVEKAKKFLETSKQLTEEQRTQIENAIKLKEEYDKAQEALENVVGETVGSFADDMADAVWEGLTKGANAWDIFREKGNEALVSLGKQMLKEFAISTYLEQFKEKLKTAYGSGDTNAIAKIYTDIFDGIPMVLENMTIAGQHWIDLLKENGYDITQEGATSGSTGTGYKTEMSHEDASEINGRLTDIQMQMRLGVASISSIKNDTDILRAQTIQAVDHLYRIERNTNMLSSIDGRLQKIEKNTANL